jgi:hypothetical protein
MDRTEWHRVNYACLSACLSVCLSVIDRDRVCWSLLSVPFEHELAELSHVRHAKHVPVQVRYIQYGTVPLQYRTHARLQNNNNNDGQTGRGKRGQGHDHDRQLRGYG